MADARAREGAIRMLLRDDATPLWRPRARKGVAMPNPGGTAAFVKCLPIAHFWGLWRRQLAMLRGAVSLSLGGRAGELGPPIWLTRAREGGGQKANFPSVPICPNPSQTVPNRPKPSIPSQTVPSFTVAPAVFPAGWRGVRGHSRERRCALRKYADNRFPGMRGDRGPDRRANSRGCRHWQCADHGGAAW